jgi:hypothetical protein
MGAAPKEVTATAEEVSGGQDNAAGRICLLPSYYQLLRVRTPGWQYFWEYLTYDLITHRNLRARDISLSIDQIAREGIIFN